MPSKKNFKKIIKISLSNQKKLKQTDQTPLRYDTGPKKLVGQVSPNDLSLELAICKLTNTNDSIDSASTCVERRRGRRKTGTGANIYLIRVISPPKADGFIFKSLLLNERDFYEFYGTYGFKSANKSISDSKLRNILKEIS
jgi:hypothetical protein